METFLFAFQTGKIGKNIYLFKNPVRLWEKEKQVTKSIIYYLSWLRVCVCVCMCVCVCGCGRVCGRVCGCVWVFVYRGCNMADVCSKLRKYHQDQCFLLYQFWLLWNEFSRTEPITSSTQHSYSYFKKTALPSSCPKSSSFSDCCPISILFQTLPLCLLSSDPHLSSLLC